MIMETPPKLGMAPVPIPVPVPVITEHTVPEPIGSGAVAGTPVKSTTTTTPATVFATPVKSSAARLAVPTTTCAAVPVTPEKSIYAQLGWDDDDDFAY